MNIARVRSQIDAHSSQPVSLVTDEQQAMPEDIAQWCQRVALMNDYVRIPFANGSSFASQFFYRELAARGHDVTVAGPYDPDATSSEMPPRHLCLDAWPLHNHPGVHLAMPTQRTLAALGNARFDLILAQTCNALLYAGIWARAAYGTPFVAVNTVHMPSVYNVILPDRLHDDRRVAGFFQETMIPWVESTTANVYNGGDGLVVLSPGLKTYWEARGVTVPIHVIPRAIDRRVFDGRIGDDPFDPRAKRGERLLVVCRHTREKEVSRLLELFASRVLPSRPAATLTLVGDGPDHDSFREEASKLGLDGHVFFAGERPLPEMRTWYRHADIFVYTSLSETYGQVVSEAMYCGLPVVAFDDGMGVAGQVAHGLDGFLVAPGPERERSNAEFATRVLSLFDEPALRVGMGSAARERAVERCDASRCLDRYYEAFRVARAHRDDTWVPQGRLDRLPIVASWTLMHSLTYGLGRVRPPATVNRAGIRAPSWAG